MWRRGFSITSSPEHKKVVECAFRLLCNKWLFLHTAINLNMQNAIMAVKAACVLHNFVLQHADLLFEDALMHTIKRAQWAGSRDSTSGAHARDNIASGEHPW